MRGRWTPHEAASEERLGVRTAMAEEEGNQQVEITGKLSEARHVEAVLEVPRSAGKSPPMEHFNQRPDGYLSRMPITYRFILGHISRADPQSKPPR